MMKAQSTGKGFVILSAAGMAVKVMSIFYIYFLLKIIGNAGYGIYSAAYQVYAFIYVLTNTGIPIAISKMISEYVSVKDYKAAVKSFKMARTILTLFGIIMSLSLALSAYPLVKILGYDKSYYSVLLLAPAVFITAVASTYRGYFQGRGNMTPTAVSQILEQLLNTIFTLVFAAILMKYGVEWGCAGGTIGTTLGALISATYLVLYYRKHHKFKVNKGYKIESFETTSNFDIINKIFSYGIPITISVGLTYAGNLVDLTNTNHRLIAGGFTNIEAYIKYGYLVKYQQLLNVPIAMVSALAVAILPAIAGAKASNNIDEVSSKINFAMRLCFMITIPAAVGLSVLSKPVFTILFTKRFVEGSDLMLFGSVVLILMSFVQIQTSILQGLGKLFSVTIFAVIGITIKIVLNYFLIAIPSININGAVFGSIIGFTIPIILNQKIIIKTLKIKISIFKHFIKPFISSAIMGIIVFLVYKTLNIVLHNVDENYVIVLFTTIFSVLVGMYVYLASMIFTKGITSEDLNILPSKFKRIIPKMLIKKISAGS